ncbi:T9SS type A sorting domain-containing protein [Flavobacterium algicola]|uniref:T9SS type A sorting domain-containing protein n=1 Tax=Flavobacterium algicola TaxID=556529 RepID=UPI0021D45EF0|nr:T9SS type A sorting domain-containing protein [Flavobacterium algicola]
MNFDQPINVLEIEILSMFGKVMKRIKGTNKDKPRIDISSLPAGNYLLRIKADGKLSVEKMIKV